MKKCIRISAIVTAVVFIVSAAGCTNKKRVSSETDESVSSAATTDILKKATGSREEQIALYKQIVDGETEWLASLQLDNGALPMTYSADGKLTLNPYFSDFAALAMLESDKYCGRVKKYADWHFAHLNTAEEDYNGLDGTIYDYTAEVSGGKVKKETVSINKGKKHYDSVDSYAATFLCVLEKYLHKSGDAAYLKQNSTDIDRVTSALLATFEGELTTTKPDYKIQYLMDNCEVYEGLAAAEKLYKSVFADKKELIGKITAAKEKVSNGIEKLLWNEKGYYETAISPDGAVAYKFALSDFYPCATSQLFMISSGLLKPESERARLLYKSFNDNFSTGGKKSSWEKISLPDSFFWGSVVYAAAIMGDEGRVESYMRLYTRAMKNHAYPLYNADSGRVCLAAAIMIEKLSQKG